MLDDFSNSSHALMLAVRSGNVKENIMRGCIDEHATVHILASSQHRRAAGGARSMKRHGSRNLGRRPLAIGLAIYAGRPSVLVSGLRPSKRAGELPPGRLAGPVAGRIDGPQSTW